MKIEHPALVDLIQKAYSAEKAAAFAYQGHAKSVRSQEEKQAIRQIEQDEWNHRQEMKDLLLLYDIPVSKWYESRFHLVGKLISASCYVIGWFMPFYFAGRLESGNVCEYFHMKHFFNEIGITVHDQLLFDLAIKEKEHEVYFLEQIKKNRLLPYFEKVFKWGLSESLNNVNYEELKPLDQSDVYCEIEKKKS